MELIFQLGAEEAVEQIRYSSLSGVLISQLYNVLMRPPTKAS